MELYPVFLKLKGKNCFVAGGGTVAERKIESLLEAGARVTVVAPECTERINRLAQDNCITFKPRSYRESDLKGMFLVIAATNSKTVNQSIYEESQRLGIPVNTVDDPENCSFYVPSRIRRGDLQLAVSTSGKAPYFARRLKECLEGLLYEGIEEDLEKLQKLRNKTLTSIKDESSRSEAVKAALDPVIKSILARIVEI